VLLKRFARVVATCGLLLAGYFGYCRAFAAIATHIGTPDWRVIPYDPSPSKTHVQTLDLARTTFGPGHWTSDPKKAICYYDAERGYWIFFQRYARKNGGQRIEFSPFAIIWGAKGKQNLNTLEGDLAYVDFDRPFDLVSKPGAESARIVRGMIEGRVRLRDDKGTRDNPGDDLTIGPLLSVSYDEATHRIRSDSPFELRERDIVATATGLTIDLVPNPTPPGKPAGAASGFSGAKTVWLHQNIRIFCEDVGRVGVVPGGKQAKAGERRAGDLRCDGPAQFNLPQSPPRPPGTPPGPPQPVIAQFFRNVVVRQGPLVTSPQAGMALGSAADPPDQLNADQLELTLFPAEKPAPDAATKAVASASAAAKPADPMGGLALREAVAQGHAVWLQSPSEGLEARGNELRYEKRAPAGPDRIFFRGNRETKVEKVSRFAKGPKAGQVEAVDLLRTLDVTIYLAAKPGETPTVIARGPGSMETRADRNLPVERSAEWGDKLTVQTVETSAGTRRRITLTGTPRVVSPTQGTITAREKIVAYLKPKERPAAPATPPAAGSPAATEAFQIDWVEGHGGVHMAAVPPPAGTPAARDGLPGSSRTLHARDKLYVVFSEAAGTPAAGGAAPAIAPVATIPGAALPPDAKPDATATAKADPKAPPKKPEPALSVEADEVWARVRLGSIHGKPELEEVRLRKGVTLHQDPAEGKPRGTDASGEAIDFVNRGEGRAWLEAHGTAAAPARVVTDTFLIEGPKLGVDQAADFAWVKGAGRMVQDAPPAPPKARTAGADREVVPTAFRADEPAATPDGPKPRPKDNAFALAKGPVTITWRQEMQFYGQPADTPDRHAWALFLGDVKVVTPESSLSCGQMKAFLDGPVVFQRPERERDPNAPPEATRSKPRIATVRCLKNVDLVHRQAGPDGKTLEQKGRVTGQDLSYSLATGRFVGDGAGVVWLYKPKGTGDDKARGPLASPTPPGLQRTVATVAREEPDDGDRALFGAGAKARKTAPLELTRVAFNKRVQGRVGSGEADPTTAPGGNAPFLAEFLGGVQVINAPIADENADLDPDDPPGGFMMLTSETLKVVRERPAGPRPASPEDAPAEQLFIDATGDPQALAPPRSIKGDRITYDSVKELVYVYGDEGGVSIINQDGAGQPFSASRGRAVMYNRKSGRIEFIDPKNVLLIDPRSGIRERPLPPGAARPPAPPRRPSPVRAVPSNDKERRGFNGR
jgi:hypothetical protein